MDRQHEYDRTQYITLTIQHNIDYTYEGTVNRMESTDRQKDTLLTISRSLQLTAAIANGVTSISVEPNPH